MWVNLSFLNMEPGYYRGGRGRGSWERDRGNALKGEKNVFCESTKEWENYSAIQCIR
jgi:hypothetical protein